MKRRFLFHYICLLLTSLSLSGCAGTEPAMPTPNAPVQAGKALLRGRLLNPQGVVIANRAVHLAPIYGEGAQLAHVFDSATGIGRVTAANGGFVMVNIPPGRYVFLVACSGGFTGRLRVCAGRTGRPVAGDVGSRARGRNAVGGRGRRCGVRGVGRPRARSLGPRRGQPARGGRAAAARRRGAR